MKSEGIVNQIFDELIADAEKDNCTSTELQYLEKKRKRFILLVRYAPQAEWDIELTADEIQLLAEGIDPRLIQSEHLIEYWPLIAITREVEWD